ncbi:MAG: hypothetical protein LBP67_07810 [Bacteroidales bacterium]|jgi:hypothetical protein|nr:hypothetical protein [Bacteroidales bacterium]
MKKTFITLITLLISISSFAQYIDFYDECLTPDSSETSAKYLCNSKDGYDFPTKGTYRMLVIFINIIYDVTPDLDPNIINGWGWEADTIGGINLRPPKQYFDDVFDTHNTLPRQGFFTKYMSECSFDSLVILADFTSVGIRQSQIQSDGGSFEYLKLRDSTLSFINNEGGLQAYYNHNSISDYDNATCGYPPTPTNNDKLDYVAFFVLNPTLIHGGSTIRPGCGVTASGMNKKIKISNVEYNIEAWTMFGIGIISLKHSGSILIHEFAHGLLGGNEFHTSGGNHLGTKSINTFIYKQQGFGLFNSGNSFRSCNAYERWRLGWQHPSNTAHRIAAGGKNSDIVSQFSGIQTFYLRDFVTYGDVIRIKLPYKDSEEASNQYIWLENHQVGRNGKLDGFNYHFYPNVNCVPLGTPGIYSYIQVGKDILEGEDSIVFYNRETDNLRMISGEGNYNMEYKNNINDCIPWSTRPTFEYLGSNPLSGTNDLTEAIITSNNNLHLFDDFTFVGNKWKDNILYNQLIWYGDTLDAFTSGTKMDISSNPPPINAYTYYAKYYTANPNVYVKEDNYRDTRKKYLTGLSIKMNYAYTLADGTEVFKVDIRWDDYDVKENVNWAGDIVLKEELYLLPDKTITFEQNYTVYQTERDNITGVFAPPTLFTCEENSIFCQNSNSHVEVTERSTILLKSGSKYIISEGADLIIKAGCTLEVEDCAILEIKGQLIVEGLI